MSRSALSTLLVGIALVVGVAWQGQGHAAGPRSLEGVNSDFGCPCGCNMVLAECECDVAGEVKATIRQLENEGKSEEEVQDSLVAKFGEGVLATPRRGAPGPSLASADESGIIEGTVVNGSEGGGSVADLEVVATASPPDAQPQQISGRTDSSGAFRLEGIPIAEDYLYWVAVRYGDLDYYSENIELTPDNPVANVQVTVYEPTANGDAIRVTMDHLAVEVVEEGHWLQVVNYVNVANDSDRTYIGETNAEGDGLTQTLHFSLPAEAAQLQFHQGLRPDAVVMTEDGFADTMPVLPGGREVSFAYWLPYSSDQYIFRANLNYLTDKLTVLVPANGVQVQSSQLSDSKQVESGGRSFTVISGEGLPAGTTVEVTLTGLPKGEGNLLADMLRPAVVVLVILALGVAFAYPFLRRRFSAGGGDGGQA